MADEGLRAKERAARLGGPQERRAWLVALRRARAPEALAAEVLTERLQASLTALRTCVNERFEPLAEEAPLMPCPELPLDGVMRALETALRPREDFAGAGYGSECLASYWPSRALPYAERCRVFAFAAHLGGELTLGLGCGLSAKPTPGTVWRTLSPWRESLKPKTKLRKLKAWVAAERALSDNWRSELSLESVRFALDFHRLPLAGEALEALAPLPARASKVSWRGVLLGVQPRLKLERPFQEDEYFGAGYALRFAGEVDGVEREFVLGIGAGAQRKHAFRVGDRASGAAKPVEDPTMVPVDFYRASKLTLEAREGGAPANKLKPDQAEPQGNPPPWAALAPELDEFRSLTPRRLPEDHLESAPCRACHWGCRAQVDGLQDYPNPLVSLCFGPCDCPALPPEAPGS